MARKKSAMPSTQRWRLEGGGQEDTRHADWRSRVANATRTFATRTPALQPADD
jgi:hypothetical protein